MPKLKTKSAVKKRFKLTATGRVRGTQAGKQHFMRRRSNGKIRDLRGTTIIAEADAKNIKKYFLPYGI